MHKSSLSLHVCGAPTAGESDNESRLSFCDHYSIANGAGAWAVRLPIGRKGEHWHAMMLCPIGCKGVCPARRAVDQNFKPARFAAVVVKHCERALDVVEIASAANKHTMGHVHTVW